MAAWAAVGALVNLAPIARLAIVTIVMYGAYYGLIEISGRRGLPAPGRTWQVPAAWVDQAPRWRRVLVWGSLLGPGFATRNPYAGFGMLVLFVASIGDLRMGVAVAVLVGLLHSLGRAAGLVRDIHRTESADYLETVLRSLRWRTADGLAMLAVCGTTVTTLVLRG